MAQVNNQNLHNFNFFEWDSTLTETVMAEYIWIDGTGENLRSKTKVYNKKINSLEDLEWWTYDGSSTEQACTQNSEIYLKPVCYVKDPLRKNCNAILVLCETFTSDKVTPARYNFRYLCSKVMQEASSHDPWFGIEQEFFMTSQEGRGTEWPLGFPVNGFPEQQGRYYCGIGASNAFGRSVIESALRAFLSAGLQISGINGEVAPGQWEYQVGIAKGMECGDHMWLSRYILARIGEEFGCTINLKCKPIKGDWNGSGCHTNFSTNLTRAEGGLNYIRDHCMVKLKERHFEHLYLYGKGNEERLTGKHETASKDEFTYGEGNRGASSRIPVTTMESGKGYFEDRRPGSNIDAYLVSAIMVDTCCLESKYLQQLKDAYEKSVQNQF